MKKSELKQIIKECIMELSNSSFLEKHPIPKISKPTEKEMLNWIKNIDDEKIKEKERKDKFYHNWLIKMPCRRKTCSTLPKPVYLQPVAAVFQPG